MAYQYRVDIGTAPQQVSTNAMLGGLAFRDAATVPVPASATAPGKVGDIATDGSYIYICSAADTWRRVAVATW